MWLAVCNELFGDRPFPEQCRLAAVHGFHGIELAPYTLAEDPTRMPPARRRELRRTLEESGLTCAGLHWLLKAPAGLHLTTGDAAVRQRTWEAMRRLVDLCRDLRGEVMVLGSGKQRGAQGVSRSEACRFLQEGLTALAPHAKGAGVRVLVEALPAAVTDVVNTLDEARQVIAAIGSPAVAGIFDFHNAKDEGEPWDRLIARHFDIIRHVHLNEVDGRHPSPTARPGRAHSDFAPAFRALAERRYPGWVSLEIFHADDPPEAILPETRSVLAHLESPSETSA